MANTIPLGPSQTDGYVDRQRQICRQTETDMQTDRKTDRKTDMQTDRKTDRQSSQTDKHGQTVSQSVRQTERQTDRQQTSSLSPPNISCVCALCVPLTPASIPAYPTDNFPRTLTSNGGKSGCSKTLCSR